MKKWLWPFTIVCFFAGFFLSYQWKIQTSNTQANPLSERNAQLITIITNLEREINLLEEQIAATRQELTDLQNTQTTWRLSDLKAELKKAQLTAGLLPVKGKGIIITLDDNNEGLKVNPSDDPNKYLIHYKSILNIVSELKVAGAEAIEVNGQRLINTTEIRCVGNVILVNTTRLAPPFVIKAIGSPKLLNAVTGQRELAILRASQFPVTVQEAEEIIIPAYKSDLQFNYTKIVKEEEE
ncbi:MAG: DUF881 domain-containing protein [Peptococcia bacterium]